MALDNPMRSGRIIAKSMKASDRLFEVLRLTIIQVEQGTDLRPDDPAIAELKSSIMRTVAELEMRSSPEIGPDEELDRD